MKTLLPAASKNDGVNKLLADRLFFIHFLCRLISCDRKFQFIRLNNTGDDYRIRYKPTPGQDTAHNCGYTNTPTAICLIEQSSEQGNCTDEANSVVITAFGNIGFAKPRVVKTAFLKSSR